MAEQRSYRFQGLEAVTIGKKAYLVFSVTKVVRRCNDEGDSYKVGDKFSLTLPINLESDNKWHISVSAGLKILDSFSDDAFTTFIIEAVKAGKQLATVRYADPAHVNEGVPKLIRYNITD